MKQWRLIAGLVFAGLLSSVAVGAEGEPQAASVPASAPAKPAVTYELNIKTRVPGMFLCALNGEHMPPPVQPIERGEEGSYFALALRLVREGDGFDLVWPQDMLAPDQAGGPVFFHCVPTNRATFEAVMKKETVPEPGHFPQEPPVGNQVDKICAFYEQPLLALLPSLKGPGAYNSWFVTLTEDDKTISLKMPEAVRLHDEKLGSLEIVNCVDPKPPVSGGQ